MPVPLLYIYINRLASTPSVELVNNGEMWERLQVCLIILIKLSFLSIKGTNTSMMYKHEHDVQRSAWCTNVSVIYKCEFDVKTWAWHTNMSITLCFKEDTIYLSISCLIYLLSVLLCLQVKIQSNSVKLNSVGQCILIWINLW